MYPWGVGSLVTWTRDQRLGRWDVLERTMRATQEVIP